MKKIGFILLVIVVILLGSIVFLKKNNISKSISWSVIAPNYIFDNYNKELHHLNLRAQNITQMPDICKDIVTGNLLYDIWSIDLSDNKITDINTDYGCLSNLQELNLSYNQIVHIRNIDNLVSLQKIELHKNNITDVDWLENLKSLKELNLGYNQITSVKGLENLSNLTTLELQHNQINDIGPLENLRNLETLKVEYNQIKDPIQFDAIKEVIKGLKFFSTWENVK